MLRGVIEFVSANIFDKKFRKDYKHYGFQCLVIFISVSIILYIGRFFDAVIAASLGASSFILFAAPHAGLSRTRYPVGGYICGAVTGIFFNYIYYFVSAIDAAGIHYALTLVSAASVALATFLMVITNCEHPPAAALALGLSTETRCLKGAAAAITGVVILCLIRNALKKRLINLI